MTVECLIEDARWQATDLPRLAQVAVAATLDDFGLDPDTFDVSLMACDDARIATLNADFRGKPQPTNVLSWPSEERGAAIAGEMPLPPDPTDPELGDIALAYETCLREAEAAGKSIADHVTHLVIHATLHLLGFDHVRDADATLMEGIETQILGKLGLPDPYSEEAREGDS